MELTALLDHQPIRSAAVGPLGNPEAGTKRLTRPPPTVTQVEGRPSSKSFRHVIVIWSIGYSGIEMVTFSSVKDVISLPAWQIVSLLVLLLQVSYLINLYTHQSAKYNSLRQFVNPHQHDQLSRLQSQRGWCVMLWAVFSLLAPRDFPSCVP